MGLAKKGTRSIRVDGDAYRWMVSPDDGFMVLVVEPAGGRSPRLEAVFRYYDVCKDDSPGGVRVAGQRRSITPGVVEAVVRAAVCQGWRPSEKGSRPFRIHDADALAPIPDEDDA